MNQHFPPEASSVHTPPDLTDAQIRSLVPNIYFGRRQEIMPCSWSVVLGIEMENVALHQFFTLQLFRLLGQLAGFSRADIAEGLLLLTDHDGVEPLTVDRNIYSGLFVKSDDEAAMNVLQEGLPFAEFNLRLFHDYETGKKDFHPDPRINAICKLGKDADGLERIVEQIEKLAQNIYPRRRWERQEVQDECQYKRDGFNFEPTKRLYDAIMDYGEDAFDDAFLRLPNLVKNRTHGKYAK